MNKYIGDKLFYKKMLSIAVPIMVQQGITNFVNLLDSIMVGQIGTEQMSGVAIVNQIIFIFNLFVFGGSSGAGIFTAQYYGRGDNEGVMLTTRFKLVICSVISLIAMIVLGFFGRDLINLFLHDTDSGNIELALKSGLTYSTVMILYFIPTSMVHSYASTLREMGETVVPMKAGAAAVVINLVLNYILIFEHFGFFGYGVLGAAVATVISKFAEAFIVIRYAHKHKDKNPFVIGLYKKLYIPKELAIKIIKKGFPILINEGLWSTGLVMLTLCYSTRGLMVVASANISSTIFNVFSVCFIAMGEAVSIIIGQLLGSGRMKDAKDTDNKLVFFTVAIYLVIGVLLFIAAPLFPKFYNTEKEVKALATAFIRIVAVSMPIEAFLNAAYFTIRAGGKTVITFIFDSGYMWLVTVVLAFTLTRLTNLDIVAIYAICQFSNIVKAVVGYILLRKNIWMNNIVAS